MFSYFNSKSLLIYISKFPWKLTYIDQKGLGIEIGKHYPNPIVDHHSSSKIAREKIWMVKKTEEAKFNAKKILEKHASAKGRR